MTPRELYEYAIRNGLADREMLIIKNDPQYIHFLAIPKSDVGVVQVHDGNHIAIKGV